MGKNLGWRVIHCQDFLFNRVFKSKYFPRGSFKGSPILHLNGEVLLKEEICWLMASNGGLVRAQELASGMTIGLLPFLVGKLFPRGLSKAIMVN